MIKTRGEKNFVFSMPSRGSSIIARMNSSGVLSLLLSRQNHPPSRGYIFEMANRCNDFEGGCTSEGVVLFDAIASALLNSSVCYILDRLRSTVDFEGMTTGFPRATTTPSPSLPLFRRLDLDLLPLDAGIVRANVTCNPIKEC